MAGIQLRCDERQGFNFQKDVKTPFGHITTLKIAGETFNTTMETQDSEQIEKAIKVPIVGVIRNIGWEGGHAEPIMFTCQVNAANREIAAILTRKGLSAVKVEFAFNVYEFDAAASPPVYYRSFHLNKKILEGVVEVLNENLEFDIDSDPSTSVESPENYQLYLSVMPSNGKVQKLEFSTSVKSKSTKNWGSALPIVT